MRSCQLVPLAIVVALNTLPANSAENASLSFDEAYYLDVPVVDIPGAPGAYRDAIFEKRPTDPAWKLIAVNQALALPSYSIKSVETVVSDDQPQQVFLRIRGSLPACSEVGHESIAMKGFQFSVTLFYAPVPPTPPGESPRMCLDVMVDFVKVLPMPVYGLNAGTYTFSVNGVDEGSFVLRQKNVLPD
jgi:hypothetical protein